MKKISLSVIVIIMFGIYVVLHSNVSQNVNLTVNSAVNSTSQSTSTYKDGTFVGSSANAYYGNIQVQATIKSGKIISVAFLQYPNEQGHSLEINQQADPVLSQEAIQSQNANVDIVSGATDTSQAFIQSLTSALTQAKA